METAAAFDNAYAGYAAVAVETWYLIYRLGL